MRQSTENLDFELAIAIRGQLSFISQRRIRYKERQKKS
ncbi:MAG: hypothetical protein AABX23_05155 [Nanoarchaeota archaeon]